MNAYRIVSLVLLLLLGAVTVVALLDVGYIGIFQLLVDSSAGWQVFVDLAAALILVLLFLAQDARRRRITFWPWIVATLLLGSIAPLLYVLVYGYQPPDTEH
ncbi:hypothetical protein QGM61_08375 [Pseudohongiella sp. SYSU M77423]|uniref:hypothetical protein n=1 Tax=Pseudohongiella sp. SYSU M77423 TaxID=3042312 RepID=UPI002480CD29|nr:hypothetical protein [Pseudohongiella sp. SYSU M77423]MDH7943836.1 hypothetical protein [Pseudohongiella sp. SYSU M77423]MEC8861290.1 hypothetical protein [Pseudomonadota bacterium]